MKLSFFSSAPDLMVNWQNGVTVVVPVPGGRFGHLAQQVGNRDLTGWLFADASPMGEPRLAGTNDDAEVFVTMCHELGLVAIHASNLHVPFTGPLYGGPRTEKYLARIRDRVRTDTLPSREQLLSFLNKASD